MKMNLITTKEILDFEKEIGYELVVTERRHTSSTSRLPNYYVSFKQAEVMIGGHLVSKHGNGNTIDEAIADYCREMSTQIVAFGVYTKNRKEITFPKLVHTKLLNQ